MQTYSNTSTAGPSELSARVEVANSMRPPCSPRSALATGAELEARKAEIALSIDRLCVTMCYPFILRTNAR